MEVERPEDVLSKGVHLGFEWVVVHNGMGYRCGYVRVPKGHPWHGKEYDEVDCNVHGGVTFAQADKPCDKGGEDDAWWIGFDCGHGGDAQDPALPHTFNMPSWGDDTVKTQEYVERECRQLCDQAAAVEVSGV